MAEVPREFRGKVSVTPLAFGHSGVCSPPAVYWNREKMLEITTKMVEDENSSDPDFAVAERALEYVRRKRRANEALPTPNFRIRHPRDPGIRFDVRYIESTRYCIVSMLDAEAILQKSAARALFYGFSSSGWVEELLPVGIRQHHLRGQFSVPQVEKILIALEEK